MLFFLLIVLYIWLIEPDGPSVLRLPILAALLYLPVAAGHAAGDGLRAIGLRIDNLTGSAREVGPVTAVGILLVGGLGLALGGRLHLDGDLAIDLLVYPAWALLQQYALQAFAFRRLREALERPGTAAATAALLFGLVHAPNPVLMVGTGLVGYVWCRLYDRHPNLITLALSHAILAALLNAWWPDAWLHNLRIGPGYFR